MQTKSPYKTAAELGIEQWEHDGLVALIGPLSRNELEMRMITSFPNSCGTACCIGGHLRSFCPTGHYAMSYHINGPMGELFYPFGAAIRCTSAVQAARAIVNFLTLGDPRWDDVMCEHEALAAILVDDFDADDSAAQVHVVEREAL